jgi:CheY-like chemotaxis protein
MAELRVLVADDDANMLDLMCRRLGRMGLQVDRAEDGRAALEMIKRAGYDLILTDIYMPGATGLDIIRLAKENDPHVQVVVVTGSATLDNAVEALNMGAFSYLTKPFDHLSVFDNAVSRALEFRRLIRDNLRLAETQRRRGDMLEAEVTDRIRQMRRRQQDMVDLLARLPQGLVVVDGDGRVVLSNALAEKWLGQEARESHQPLRRYLSTVKPPARPMTGEVEIGGETIRVTVQGLPGSDGKGRTLVILEKGGEGSELVAERVASTLEKIKPALAWLERQDLDERGGEVVRGLAVQIDALERLVRGDKRGVMSKGEPAVPAETMEEELEPPVELVAEQQVEPVPFLAEASRLPEPVPSLAEASRLPEAAPSPPEASRLPEPPPAEKPAKEPVTQPPKEPKQEDSGLRRRIRLEREKRAGAPRFPPAKEKKPKVEKVGREKEERIAAAEAVPALQNTPEDLTPAPNGEKPPAKRGGQVWPPPLPSQTGEE